MNTRLIALLVLTLSVAACGNKTPQCSDDKTVELAKRIYLNALTEKQNEPGEDASLLERMKQDVRITISTIRTAATDEKIGKVTCDAVLEAELPPAAKAALENPILRTAMQRDPSTHDLKVNGLVVSADVQYTSQMTDDKKEHLVEMRGFKGVVDLVSALGNMGVFKTVNVPPTTSDSKAEGQVSSESRIPDSNAAVTDEIIRDGFGDVASAFLKKNPVIEKCADAMVEANNRDRRSKGLDERTTSAEYGEFIGVCSRKSKAIANAPSKVQSAQSDAKPNNPTEAKKRQEGKAWQDENGLMHYPDGSVSRGSVD